MTYLVKNKSSLPITDTGRELNRKEYVVPRFRLQIINSLFMNILLYIIILLGLWPIIRRVKFISADLKGKNYSKLKVDLLFLALMILVIALLVWLSLIP